MGNKYLNILRIKRYNYRQNKEAKRILYNIEKIKGKTSNALLDKANEYALEVLGSKIYAPWLYVYSAIAGEFKEGWIPDNYYGSIVMPRMKGDYGKVSELKSLTSLLFDSEKFPDVLYRVNSLWFTPDYVIKSEEYVKHLVSQNEDKFVFKVDSTARGEGIYVIKNNNINYDKLLSLGNGVLQSYIQQHSFFNDIMPKSVATIRLTTFIDYNGIITVRAGYLRVGRNADAFIKSSSTIRIPINVNTGELSNGYLTNWQTIEKHPDTDYIFNGKLIPFYQKCVETVKDLHNKVPFVRIIGWDLVIDNERNIKVMEWNGMHNDIKFSEATQGPIFKGLGLEHLCDNNRTN